MYKDLIENKRVIFVGGCPNLVGKNQGEFIDNFDVVVRTNGSIYLLEDEKYRKDYGSRCDVLYTNNQFYREMRPFPVKAWSMAGLKYLCMKTCKEFDKREMSKHLGARIIKRAIKEVNKKLKTALMGVYLFQDIINHNPKELFVTGIDFFISKKKVFEHDNYQEYLPNYLPDKIRNQGNRINIGKKEDGHNVKDNTKYIYDLWTSGKISMPGFISDIMIKIIKGELQQQ